MAAPKTKCCYQLIIFVYALFCFVLMVEVECFRLCGQNYHGRGTLYFKNPIYSTVPNNAVDVTSSGRVPSSQQLPHVPNEMIMKQVLLLTDLWQKVAFPSHNEDDDEIDFELKNYDLSRLQVKGLLEHFQNCKDCAGDNAFLMATQNDNNEDVLRLNNVDFPMLVEDDNESDWGNFDKSLIDEGSDNMELGSRRTVFPIEPSDEIVLKDTKEWVRKIIADFGVCPFTIDPMRAGIPMGGVRYHVSRTHRPEEAFYAYWEEVKVGLCFKELIMFYNQLLC